IALLVQADCGLGSIFFSIKQSKKLAVIFPIPSRVVHVNEPFLLDLARDFGQRWECVRRRRTFRSKPFFLGEPERADSSENFQPRQKEPAHCTDKPPYPAAGNKINAKKSRSENSERASLFRIRVSIFADINFLETIALLLKIILRVDAPRTPLATVEGQFHRQRRNKRMMIVTSTACFR